MDVREYLWMLRKRWRIVLAFLLLGIAASATFSFTIKPEYSATSQLFVSTRQSDSISEVFQGGNFSQLRVKSYVKVSTSSLVLRPVIDRLRLDTTPDQLAKRVSVDAPLDTVLINITVRDNDPRRAADIANAIGSSIATVVDTIEAPSTDSRSPVTISTVRRAEPSSFPVSPNLPLNLAAGLLAGAVFGMSAALARNALDTRIHGDRDVARVTDAVLLGAVPLTSGGGSSVLISREQHDPYAEAFRKLRTNLQFVDAAGRVTSLAVTSAVQGEGKTTVAVNLALALTYAGVRTVLLDADFRRPRIAESLGLVDNVGLTTVLSGRAQVDDVLQSWGGTSLKVLAAGERPPNPSELLGSPAMKDLVRRLEEQFDVIVIDTPPLLPVTDAALLSGSVTGFLLVVGVGRARRRDLTRLLENVRVVEARVLGLVLNLIPRRGPDSAGGYGYGYGYYYRPDPEAAEPADLRSQALSRLLGRRRRRSVNGAAVHNGHERTRTVQQAEGNGADGALPIGPVSKRRSGSAPPEPSSRG